MMDAETLRVELAGLELLELRECEREVHEGEFHNGLLAAAIIDTTTSHDSRRRAATSASPLV